MDESKPPVMKKSYSLRSQRERWSEDLPFPAAPPTARPDNAPRQPPPPFQKRTSLAQQASIPVVFPEKPLRQTQYHNTLSRRSPRTPSHAKLPNQSSSQTRNGVQSPKPDNMVRKANLEDILVDIDASHRIKVGPVVSQTRPGARSYEKTPFTPNNKDISGPSSSSSCSSSSFDPAIRVLGKHSKSDVIGPRAERPATLGDYLKTNPKSTMNTKRSSHREVDYRAYRESLKRPKVFSYCSQCKGLWPNCPLCGMMKQAGIRAQTPPSEEQMIRDNAAYYSKLLGLGEDQKAQAKPSRKRRETTLPTSSRDASIYPGGVRPVWDPPPEKDPVFSSWDPNETPNHKVLWDETLTPQASVPDTLLHKSRILAPNRPKDKTWEDFQSSLPIGHKDKPFKSKNNISFATQSSGNFQNWAAGESQSPPVSPKPTQTELVHREDSPVSIGTSASKIESELQNPLSNTDFEVYNVQDAREDAEISVISHFSSSNSINSFNPDNARYKPVGKGIKDSRLDRKSPIAKLPNEIITHIIRIMLEDEGNPTGGPTETVYEQESSLQNRNLQLDSIRKTSSLWRYLCQAELYRSVPMTSSRTLRQFSECVTKHPELSRLVREVKISIPFTTIDGWTPREISRTVDEERSIATMSAKYLGSVIANCPKLSRLDASFAGSLHSLSFLNKPHIALTHLSLEDCLPRKSDVKRLGKNVKCFPNLQLLQLESSRERLAEWKDLTINGGDFLNRRLSLTSIRFKDFPVLDTFLELALPNFPSLKTLHIERCPGVTPNGLARTITSLESPKLTTLIFIRSPTEIVGRKTSNDNSHLCEAIAGKLGSSLVNLNLNTVPVCEKLGSSITNWAQLQNLLIQGKEFQGCTSDTTEGDVQAAMAVSGIVNLCLDSFVYFGRR